MQEYLSGLAYCRMLVFVAYLVIYFAFKNSPILCF